MSRLRSTVQITVGVLRPWYPALLALMIAVAVAFTICIEALRDNSLNAGFAYTQDFWHLWVGQVAKSADLLSRGVWTGIDYSTHGGSSEFFLRPNLLTYSPLLILWHWMFGLDTLQSIVRFFAVVLTIHFAISTYFLIRIAQRFLGMSLAMATFVACGYTISINMSFAIVFPPFVFCACLMPWIMYICLDMWERFDPLRMILGSAPVVLALLSGYVPLGVTAVVVSVGAALVYHLWLNLADRAWNVRAWKLLSAASPILTGAAVVLPLYVALIDFNKVVSDLPQTANFVAWNEANTPRTLFSLVADRIESAPYIEFMAKWGVIPVLIAVLFIAGFRSGELTRREARLLGISAGMYVFAVLISLGRFSALSTLFFAVPAFGKMHVYQRHLIVGQFFLILMIAIMLQAILRRESLRPAKISAAVLALLVFAGAYWFTAAPASAAVFRLNEYVLLELFLGLIFALTLLAPHTAWPWIAGAALMAFMPLQRIYDYSADQGYVVQPQRHFELDDEQRTRLLNYFRSNSSKSVIKYVDITPGLREYLSKNFPWFALKQLPLSSYGGYELHSAADWRFRRKFRVSSPEGSNELITQPDWDWLAQTGAEFIVFVGGHARNDARMPQFLDDRDQSKILRLPNNIVVGPLRFPNTRLETVLFDNGYFRLLGQAGGGAVANFETDGASRFHLRTNTSAPTRLQYLYWPNRNLRFYANGKVIEANVEKELQTISIPPGQSDVVVRYENFPQTMFLYVYAAWAFVFGLALVAMTGNGIRVLVRTIRHSEPAVADAPALVS